MPMSNYCPRTLGYLRVTLLAQPVKVGIGTSHLLDSAGGLGAGKFWTRSGTSKSQKEGLPRTPES